MAFTPPPQIPQRGARATFSGAVDAFLRWMAALPAQLDTFLARLETIAAGGAYSLPYLWGPGLGINTSGKDLLATDLLVVPNNAATGISVLPQLQQFDKSTSSSKGTIRVVKKNDPSKWFIFNVTGRADSQAGYQVMYGSVISASSATPFTNADEVQMYFQPTGDKGEVGNADKKVQTAPAPVGGVVTVDYRNGNCLVWSPTAGSNVSLGITNWPANGTLGEFWIIGTNLGAATVNLGGAINWLRPDGTYANTASINANQGATLRTAGEDNILLWGRTGGYTNGKVAR